MKHFSPTYRETRSMIATCICVEKAKYTIVTYLVPFGWQENYIAVHTEYWKAFRFFLVFFIELIFPQDLSLLNVSTMDRFQEKQSMRKVKWALKPNTNMLTFKDVSLCRVQSRTPWTNGSQGEWWSDAMFFVQLQRFRFIHQWWPLAIISVEK